MRKRNWKPCLPDVFTADAEIGRLKLIVESAPNAIVLVDGRGCISLINAETERLFGYTRQELLGQPVELLVPTRFRTTHPGYRTGFFHHPVPRAMGEGRDLYGLHMDGHEVPIEIGLSPIESGGELSVLACIIDVTARKKAEERFRRVVESAVNAIVLVDQAGRITLINTQTERLFGYSRGELIGQPVEILVPERYRAKHPGLRAGFFAKPNTRSMGAGRDLYGLHKDGSEFPIEIGLNPIETDEGLLVLASIVDITERKRDELALRESELKMRLLTDALPALISYVDKDQIYRFTNKGYEEWFGIPVSEINGRSLRDVLGPELYDSRRHFVERALAGQSSVFELKMPAPNRSVEYAQASFIPHIGADGTVQGFYALIQDITQTRRAEQVLEHAKDQLEARVAERTTELMRSNARLQEAIIAAEEANQSKTRFFAAASHDLLQPLNAARLFIASLAERSPEGEYRKLVDNAANSFEAVDELINTLLELSRIDAGAIQAEPGHFFIDQLIGQLTTEFAPVAEVRGLALRKHCIGAVVYTDWVLLGRILRNFLSNAIRYTEHGGILLGVRRTKEGVLVGVWDQGRGIPADKLSLVFQEFQRLPEHSAMCSKGMGLGLAIVKRLALRLKHPLVVRSNYGRGSFFGIVLPHGKAEVARQLLSETTVAGQAVAAESRSLTILLIDNEPAILEGMTTLLAGWNCQPIPVTGMAEALAVLDCLETPPDAILADYHLNDGMTGVQVIRAVNAKLGRSLPAAIITADHTNDVSAETAESGWGLLTKPVRPAQLRALIGHFAKLSGGE